MWISADISNVGKDLTAAGLCMGQRSAAMGMGTGWERDDDGNRAVMDSNTQLFFWVSKLETERITKTLHSYCINPSSSSS